MRLNNRMIRDAQPMNYNLGLAEELGLSDGENFTDEYFELQAYYGKCYFVWLDKQIDLNGADKALGENEMRFLPVDEENETIYQATQSYGMHYFFIRNNFCIERLDAESLKTLRDAAANDLSMEDEEIQELIEDTWAFVICYDPEEPMDSRFFLELKSGTVIQNDSILIGLSTKPEYDEQGMYVDAENESNKAAFLKDAVPQLEELFSSKAGCSVVIVYLP